MKAKFKPIFIVSNWKSGSTPLQFALATDPDIYNFFPTKDTNYDGTRFWRKHGLGGEHRKFGDHIPELAYESINKDAIISELNDMFDDKCTYGLLKRPQFVCSIDFIKWLFDDDVIIIGIKRDYIPTAYSYYRSNQSFRDPNQMYVGLKPPGWIKYKNKSLYEYIAWTYTYAIKEMERHNIPIVLYEKLADDPIKTADVLSKIVGKGITFENVKINNLNDSYKRGANKRSRNIETAKGQLTLEQVDGTDVLPFCDTQINLLTKYLEEYK